ncbi:hypothetical protein PHLGIDRAFT_107356 [Phlebiopsis gigantea 11061_1 CR5-6]|uniref:RNA polymerase II-associated protein n=1 Tax=Phlebiopsis gigantea (strain 11061_1 CR5-6) TaxID=745531 RepID=A0A0C3S6C4_PHLG1|nr:hypothetical protein PHLGIDRAFT_107356 [Phlebiopsis gigantea 11061_1 CR5-6]
MLGADETRSPSPAPGRSLDIELSGQEIITVDLDNLDANPEDLLDVLRESQSKGAVWAKLASEYWRKGNLDAAEKLAAGGIESFSTNAVTKGAVPPLASILANIQVERARKAPKLVLQDARQDKQTERTQAEYIKDATSHVYTVDRYTSECVTMSKLGQDVADLKYLEMVTFLTRGILQLSTREMDDALRSFENVLASKPTNILALIGKARILYAKRQFPQALRIFQDVLRYNPSCIPDPRIGIGLCFWALDHKAKAKAAWERSVEVNPSEWPAQLLLGLEAINSSKNENQSEEERRKEFLFGTRLIEKAFNANQKNSAAANALCELFLRKGQHKRAMKLAERTIQFADTLTVLTEGYLRAARVLQAEGSHAEAAKYFITANQGQPGNVLAAIGLAQTHLKKEETFVAIMSLDKFLQPPNAGRSVVASAMLASLRAHLRPGMSSSEHTKEKAKARELFDRVIKTLYLPEQTHQPLNGQGTLLTRSQRRIAEDVELHAEIAKLFYQEDIGKVERAFQEAVRLSDLTGRTDPRLLNNLGALRYLSGHSEEARVLYERALTDASSQGTRESDSMATSLLYNLARVYEDQGEGAKAKEAYEKLLSRHPEYVDAKIRLAQMLVDLNRHNDAHELLKQALASQNGNLNLRAFYTHFLIQSNLPKPARDFVFSTLKDHDKHDIYSLCSAGWIQYHQARESRDSSPKGVEERKRGFQRAAEFYEKALHLDPMCAIAAQGLAIVTAEDALGTLGGSLGPITPDEAVKRVKNAREALDVFAKVRESLDDGSVYSNMGHCYYAGDEFDRAIESYETASKKFYDNHNVGVLLCLCRAWYAKANKDQSFTSMGTALKYAQQALHLHPHDKAIVYNIAMIEQKAAEMLLSVKPAKRSLKELERAIEQATHAQKLFQSLAADKSTPLPYSTDIADQRRKYGESVLRRCDDHLATQKAFESETQAKLEDARRRRQEEKDKLDELERERQEKLRHQAEELAEQRRLAREEAQKWTLELKDSDDEKEPKKTKKSRARTRPDPGLSGDEGEPRKKRRPGKLRKDGDGGEDDGALFSGDEDGESKPAARKRTKKRVVRDDDDEETAPKRKQIKTKEYISDSDDEMPPAL